jgi:hypothetical protein
VAHAFIGAAVGTTTATIPAHQAGDLLIAFAFRSGSTTLPTMPSTPAWVQVRTGAAQTAASRVAYFMATGSGTVSGTWTNAGRLIILVYRGAFGVGASSNVGSGSSTNVALPALTLQEATSWVLRLAAHRTSASLSLPSGNTSRSTTAGNPIAAAWDSNAELGTVDAPVLASTASATSGWHAYTVELLEAPTPTAQTPVPNELAVVAGVAAPTATLGGITGTPDPVGSPVLVDAPAAALGALAVTPDAIGVPVVVDDPTVAQTGPTAATPDPLGVAVVVDPPAATLTVAATPDALALTAGVTGPSATLTTAVTPDPLAVPAAVTGPTATLTVAPSPTAVTVTVAVDPPGVELGPAPGFTAVPDPLALVVALGAPAATLGPLAPSPTPLGVTAAVAAPTATLTVTATPDPITLGVGLDVPAMSGALAVTPDDLALLVVVDDPGVVIIDRASFRDITVKITGGPTTTRLPAAGPAAWEPVTGGPTVDRLTVTGPRS